MIDNYTPRDIAATAGIIPVFAIFLLAPGYVFGWATNLLQFGRRSISERILLSIPFSIVISTMLANFAGRYVPAELLLWLFVAIAIVFAFHISAQCFQLSKENHLRIRISTRVVVVATGLWTLGMIACLVDLQFGSKLNINAAMWDHAVRIAFINSALKSGPPPKNPFSFIGHAPIARYYYYWYVLCSYPARLTHISARCVFYASSVWAGFSLAALVPLYLKEFLGISENLRRKSVLGILLLSVTGLDIIPTLYEFIRANTLSSDMEAWDPAQVTSWQDALIWVPHHVASLVACFMGFLALWSVRRGSRQTPTHAARLVAGIFAALAFSAAAGLSVYVTFTFALYLLCWGFRLLYKGHFQDLFLYLWTACLSIVISLPYLHDLLGNVVTTAVASTGSGEAKSPIVFGLRVLPSFLQTPHFLVMRGFFHPELLAPFGVLAVYVLEFGFFAIVGWERFRRDLRKRSRLDEAEIAGWYLIAVSMFVITFMRSEVIANNDLAFRSAMIAQFVLLLWGADYLDRWIFSVQYRPNRMSVKNIVIASTLLLGLIGTMYGVTMLRVYTLLDDRGLIARPATWLPKPPHVGTALLAIRRAYGQLDKILPAGSIVQYNPMTDDYIPLLEYDRFQSVDAFPDCGTEFGGDSSKCPPVQDAIANLFNKPGAYNIYEICTKLSIDVLVARKSDPAWRNGTSWVWSNPPIVGNSYIRAFRCR